MCGKSKYIWMNSSRSNQGSAFKHLPPLIHLGRLKCRLSLMGQRIDLFDFNWGSTDVKHGAVWQIFQAFVLGGSNLLKIHRGYVQPNVAILVKRSFLAPSSLTPFSVCKVFVGPRVNRLVQIQGRHIVSRWMPRRQQGQCNHS